jgi:hypothetical protein
MRPLTIALICSMALLANQRALAAPPVQEADASMVAACRFVGTVTGTSGWGGLAQSTGIKQAKKEALKHAAKLGATHLVWLSIAGGWAPSVSGNAYKCGAGPSETTEPKVEEKPDCEVVGTNVPIKFGDCHSD